MTVIKPISLLARTMTKSSLMMAFLLEYKLMDFILMQVYVSDSFFVL